MCDGPGGHALFACMGTSVPFALPGSVCDEFLLGGDAMMPGASVVGTIYTFYRSLIMRWSAWRAYCQLFWLVVGLNSHA